ncbi:hypothetical protein TNCT_62901 [Trichonephila clavata]|uniref:Uncharacterized protein n=1 Tax=Trichonephila clavata TaxID=2740835 RepID=A0A8X6HH99_TRICU|nr:hypothetical protein TNCT_62901 [Trichonephila clavata]
MRLYKPRAISTRENKSQKQGVFRKSMTSITPSGVSNLFKGGDPTSPDSCQTTSNIGPPSPYERTRDPTKHLDRYQILCKN